ncbi:MAG: hypothetical protein CMQ47_03475 [Gammaproteobacteria bacterium]|nr:hypothetical protein [Gammaproteobacteria bacterium]
MWTLELNDTEISLAQGLDVVYRQPGVAVVLDDRVSFGDAALEQTRLHPRQAQTQYWHQLSADPIAVGGRTIKNHADLVYQHLLEIKRLGNLPENEPVFVAVPSNTSPEQLSLLLGIANEASIQISALADLAVATASTLARPGHCTFLDNGFHRTILTRLETNGSVSRTSYSEAAETGFQALVEGWIDAVADLFVQETRFDPLRIADTEQQLFSHVLKNVASCVDEFLVEVSHAGESRRVAVTRSLLATKSSQRLDALLQQIGDPTTIVLSHRIARVPGLTEVLRAAGHDVNVVEPHAIFSAAMAHEKNSAQSDGGVSFITQFASANSRDEPTNLIRVRPTHLLHGTEATSLSNVISDQNQTSNNVRGFCIELEGSEYRVLPMAKAEVKINGVVIDSSTSVAVGDIIRSDSEEFQLIRVIQRG